MAGIQVDGANQKVVLDSDGDTYLEAATDDTVKVYVAGAQDFTITANTLTAESGSTIAAQALTATTVTASGIVKTDDATEATSTTDGSLQTDGGLSVVKDAVFGDDVKLLSDSSVVAFGADGDTTLTHTDGTGLTLNSTNKICFNDATQFVQGSSGTVLSIGATDEIDLTATAVDLNGTLDVSGTSLLTGRVGVVTAGDLGNGIHIRISDAGAISGGLNTDGDDFVIEHSGSGGMSIITGTSSQGGIYFGDSGDADIGVIRYDHANNSMDFFTNGTEKMSIDGDGHVTNSSQPAFNVNSATMNNLAINTTHTVQFNSERFDNNADFNTSNYTFTAPVTGRYQLQFQINIEGMDEATSYYRFKIATSNEDYNTMLVDPSLYDSDGTWHLVTYCILADMDASDTSTVEITVTNDGAAQADVSNRSVFSGFLVC